MFVLMACSHIIISTSCCCSFEAMLKNTPLSPNDIYKQNLLFEAFSYKNKVVTIFKVGSIRSGLNQETLVLFKTLAWISISRDSLALPYIMKKEVIKFLYLKRIGLLFRFIVYFLLTCSMGGQTDTASYVCLCICAVCAQNTQILWGAFSWWMK